MKTMMMNKDAWLNIQDPEKYMEAREKAYRDFFGDNWRDFEDMGCCQDVGPETAADILMEAEAIDYCPCCDYYYFRQGSVYYCPSCHSLGNCSEPDNERY